MASLRSPPIPFRFPAPPPHPDHTIDDRDTASPINSRPQSSHNEEAMSGLRLDGLAEDPAPQDSDRMQEDRIPSHRPSRSDDTSTSAKDTYDLPSSRSSRFRFKDKDRPRSSRDRSRERHHSREEDRSDRHRSSKRKPDREHTHTRHRHRSKSPTHRSKRHKSSLPTSTRSSPPPKPSIYEPDDPVLDSEALFRESLFDALADDEGAQFWEGVYGQPIPFDEPYKPKEGAGEDGKGELERMTEEEYIQHIRQEMWKKTNQALLEEREHREKRRREKEKVDEEERRKAREDVEFQRRVEESLRRGRERKDQQARAQGWKERWNRYLVAWDSLSGGSVSRIPWPVYTGTVADLSKEEIEKFLMHGSGGGVPQREELVKALKVERVRWHPDKMQQKLGKLDDEVLKNVIIVFQIVDELWSENKDS